MPIKDILTEKSPLQSCTNQEEVEGTTMSTIDIVIKSGEVLIAPAMAPHQVSPTTLTLDDIFGLNGDLILDMDIATKIDVISTNLLSNTDQEY